MINYQTLIDEAILGVIKKVLKTYAAKGPQDNQCFYISFETQHPGVKLSSHVKRKHPYEITIILENQFDKLKVEDDHLTVDLVFGGVSENVSIPFGALTSFVDPVANFTLQLQQHVVNENDILDEDELIPDIISSKKQLKQQGQGEVVDFNNFKKSKHD